MRFRRINESAFDYFPDTLKKNISLFRDSEQQRNAQAYTDGEETKRKTSDVVMLYDKSSPVFGEYKQFISKILRNNPPSLQQEIVKSIRKSGIHKNNTFAEFVFAVQPQLQDDNSVNNFKQLYIKVRGNNDVRNIEALRNPLLYSRNSKEFNEYVDIILNNPNVNIFDEKGNIKSLDDIQSSSSDGETTTDIDIDETNGIPKIPKNATVKFNKADKKTQMEIIKRILTAYNTPNSKNLEKWPGIVKATYNSAEHYGLDPTINPFLQFLARKKFPINDKMGDSNMVNLFELNRVNNIDLVQPFILDGEFMGIPDKKDFIYTVKLLDVINNPNKLKRFFKDPDVVNEEELHIDNNPNNNYKPAGIGKHLDPDTLFGTVELWSDANDVSKEKNDVLTISQLKDIIKRDDDGNKKLKDIEADLRAKGELKDGVVCYSKNIEHVDSTASYKEIQKNIDDMQKNGKFYIWSNNRWEPYINERTKKVLGSM